MDGKGPQITFEKDIHDFGKIQRGTVAKYKFKFTNTGDQPLLLQNVKASCGCTTPSWSKEPIMPGKDGYIEAAFNSTNAHGTFTKSITVTTNIPDFSQILFIKGEVIEAENTIGDPNQSPVRVGQ